MLCGFGVVNTVVAGLGVVFDSRYGIEPESFVGVKAPVVPMLGVVDFVSRYGRYPVSPNVVFVVVFVNRYGR